MLAWVPACAGMTLERDERSIPSLAGIIPAVRSEERQSSGNLNSHVWIPLSLRSRE